MSDDIMILLSYYKDRGYVDCMSNLKSRFLTDEDLSHQFFNDYFALNDVKETVAHAHKVGVLTRGMSVECPNCRAKRFFAEQNEFPIRGFSIYFKAEHQCANCGELFSPSPKEVVYGSILDIESLPMFEIENDDWKMDEEWTYKGRLKRWFRKIIGGNHEG